MAKIAVLLAATMDLIGVAATKETAKFVQGDHKDEEVLLVTPKTFVASERYPTFKDMCTVPLTEEEKAAAQKEADDKKAAGGDIGEAGANKAKRSTSADLAGTYHLTKALPACADDHPKFPIWKAIAENTTVETAKAACPEVNPPRKTNGVYTFTSEFRYFLKTGHAAMGDAPEAKEEVKAETEQAAA